MSYDVLPGGNAYYEDESESPWTLGDLLKELENSTANSVRFIGTDYTVGSLHSWRGSYDIPALDYECDYKSPQEIAAELKESMQQVHHGYKGGEYRYYEGDEFYVAHRGSSSEHKVVSCKTEGGVLYLCTKIVPY